MRERDEGAGGLAGDVARRDRMSRDAEVRCREAKLLFPWLAAGGLLEGERLEVYSHLRECPECREELRRCLALVSLARDAVDALQGPPPSVREALASRLAVPVPAAGGEPPEGDSLGLLFARMLVGSVRARGPLRLALASLQWALDLAASEEGVVAAAAM